LGERFASFLGTLLLRFGTTSKIGSPKPRKDLFDTWLSFTKQIECVKLEEKLNEVQSSLLADVEYTEGLGQLVATICETYPDEISRLYEFLLPYLKGNFKGQRLVVVVSYSEMMNWAKDTTILQNIINALLISMIDADLKLQSIIGIGNAASAGAELMNKFAASVMDALMSMIDNKDDVISIEAMKGLEKVFLLVECSRVQPILINIIHRIRPHLEKPNPKIRASAFSLTGTLARFGTGDAAEVFKEQMHNTLPSIFVHLCDPDMGVQIACKTAVKRMVSLFESEQLADLMERKWFDPTIKLPFDRFAEDFAKRFVADFPELIPTYVTSIIEFFQSNWHQIRAGAATLAANLLFYLPPDRRGTLNAGILTTAFINLLTNQKEPNVRQSAASAMKLLRDY
jgi:hypothetical protein